jgi:adenine phosphoribosyltransferase
MHTDAVGRGERVLLVDDLLATGGTAEATLRLLEGAGAVVVGCAFLVDLPDLGGRARLMGKKHEISSICEFSVDE